MKKSKSKGKAPSKAVPEAAEAKVKSDIKRAEKLTRKAMGALPVFHVAAETAGKFMDKLETMLRGLGEGLKTGAVASTQYNYDRALALEERSRQLNEYLLDTAVIMMQANEADLRTQGEIMLGLADSIVGIAYLAEDMQAIGEAFAAYLAGDYPEFPEIMKEGLLEVLGEAAYDITHPLETIAGMGEAFLNASPREQGKMVMDMVLMSLGGAAISKGFKIAGTIAKKLKVFRSAVKVADEVPSSGTGTVARAGEGKTIIINDKDIPGYANITCFEKGTLIYVRDGHKRIEDIKVNDFVWSEDIITGKKELKHVKQVFKHYQKNFIYIHINSDIIKTTAEHPFWTQGNGWSFARDIKIRDLLKNNSDENITINLIEVIHLEKPVIVYNLEIEDWHTYYVSENNILVHNKANMQNKPGWIEHNVYNEIRNRFGEKGIDKFVNSMNKGLVAGVGENGIKMLTGKGVEIGGKYYQYEIKVKGGFGDWRVYGNYDSTSGHIIFDKFATGAH